MHPRGTIRLAGLTLCLLTSAACSAPTTTVPDAAAPADAAPHPDAAPLDAAASDRGGVDADPDAGSLDAGPDDASPADAAPDAGAVDAAQTDTGRCEFPPLMVDGPFAAGPAPASAYLLLTDTASRAIFKLALDGAVLTEWHAPHPSPYGVTHDLRNADGFYVGSYGQQARAINKLSWAGAVTATITYPNTLDGFRGMSFILGSTAADDVVGFICSNTNAIDVVGGVSLPGGGRAFESLVNSDNNERGLLVVRYACDDASSLVYWTTTASTVTLKQWASTTVARRIALPTTDARGIARTPRGDFFVVDHAGRRVLHLDPTGSMLGAFATPGAQPADLSYGE